MFNSLRPRQNGRLFADDTFKCIFLNENIRISTKNSLKFVPKGLINNIPALVLIMAWPRPGDKPLYLNQCWLDHWRIYASLGLNELKQMSSNKKECKIKAYVQSFWQHKVMILSYHLYNRNPYAGKIAVTSLDWMASFKIWVWRYIKYRIDGSWS